MSGFWKILNIAFLAPALLWAATEPTADTPMRDLAEGQVKDHCESITAKRELRVFRDPELFRPNPAALIDDPKAWDRLKEQSPLLTTLKGSVELRMGEPRQFQNFAAIARLYEAADPRLRLREKTESSGTARFIPVQLCRDGRWGFVLESDLKQAALSEEKSDGEDDDVMPPSTYPNPIPRWRELKSRDALK